MHALLLSHVMMIFEEHIYSILSKLSGGLMECHNRVACKQQIFFLIVLEAGKSKTKMPVDLVSK